MRSRASKGLLASVPVLALVVLAATVASVSSGATKVAQAKKVKVALVLPCATNDQSWCEQAYVAAKRLQREGKISLQITSNAPQDTAGISQVLSRYASRGVQLVIAHSAWQDAALNVGAKFSKTKFAFAGGGKTASNVATYEEPIYQPAYLAGILAGGLTKTGVIGGLAGQDVPLCHAQLEAFKRGAKRTRANVKQLNTYIGDWNDVAKGKNATQAQADQKADVFVVCGGGPATGMVSAIKNTKLSGFGYVGDMNGLAKKNMVGSLVYNLYPFFKRMVGDVAAGKFHRSYNLGLKQRGFVLKLNKGYSVRKIPAKTMALMNKVAKQIDQGKFRVPYVPS